MAEENDIVSIETDSYYLKNRERMIEYSRRRYQTIKGKEQYKVYNRRKYLKNREIYLEKQRVKTKALQERVELLKSLTPDELLEFMGYQVEGENGNIQI